MKKKFKTWCRRDRGGKYYVQFDHSPGKWFSTGTTEKSVAEEWAYLNQVPGLKPVPEKVSLRLFAEGFFIGDSQGWVERQEKRGKNLREKTLQSYQGYLNNHLLPVFGPRTLQSLVVRELDDFFIALPQSNATKNKILHALRLVLQEACDQQLIPVNIAKEVKSFVEHNQHPEIFTPDELAKLFPKTDIELMRVWKAYSWAVFFRVMAVGGLRPGEVAALQWGDFHASLGGLIISKSIESGTNRIKGLKTENRGCRVKPCLLDDTTVRQLERLRELQGRPGPFELVFTVPATGAVIGPMTSNKVLRGALKRADLDTSKTQYGLRHTFQTHALQILSRDQVADIMGHMAYRQDYDQRGGEAMLRQYQGLRNKMPDLFSRSG